MCLHSETSPAVPEQTARVARAAFPKGNLYVRMREELGTLFTDGDFADLYPRRGQPAFAPWRLALVTVMQFLEDLSDRQAAEAVRARIDWKYALGLELTDAGFDFSVLSEFRARLTKAAERPQAQGGDQTQAQGGDQTQAQGGAGARESDSGQLLLDRMLQAFREKGLLKTRGRQRTDSTHVLAAIRVMNRLELVTETLRAALNALAASAPDWLRTVGPAEWYTRYSLRAGDTRLPRGDKARQEYAQTVGGDGVALLRLVDEQRPDLRRLAAVGTLRQVWDRHFTRSEAGEVCWRAAADLPRAAGAVESPYDPEARHSNKRDTSWTGYKVHLTETCDPDLPRLITDVHTTVATTQDVSCTADIQQSLADRGLLPGRHLVDTGYVDAQLLVESQRRHGVELFGPTRLNPSWQAREGGYDQSRFSISWEKQQATCPEGRASTVWGSFHTKPYDRPVVRVRFAERDCAACASRAKCVRSPRGQSRTLVLPERAHYEALQQARSVISSEAGSEEYKRRAGIEGSLSQGVRRSDLRHARYVGLAKTHLQNVATATGLNMLRAINHLNGEPLAPTRQSRFARLRA